MTKVEKFAQGAPAWVDLQSPDQEASKRFYAELFGWEFQDNPMTPEYVYSMASVGGSAVAAIAPQATEAVNAGITTAWNTYFSVDDIEAVVEKVATAGGRVLMGADDVEGFGRMALIEDSIGAPLTLWQGKSLAGAELINEPGSFVWHELAAGNWEHAVPFYLDVLGAEKAEVPMEDGSFTMLRVGGQYVAGFRDQEDENSTPRWEVYFGIADVDAGIATARASGAKVLVEPFDVEGIGRMAMLSDPQGAVFWILQEPAGQ